MLEDDFLDHGDEGMGSLLSDTEDEDDTPQVSPWPIPVILRHESRVLDVGIVRYEFEQ
jgi:hypothetical protein